MPSLRGLPIGPLQPTTPDWKSLGICCPLVLASFKHELEGMGGESAPSPNKVARTFLQVQTGKLRPGEALELVQVPIESDTF